MLPNPAFCFGMVFVLLLAGFSPATADERTWSDTTGKFQVQAELVEVVDGNAKLKKGDGAVITVPVERLSAADREFLTTAKQSGGELPSWERPLQVGDKVYLQVRKQWQLAKVTDLNAGAGSARFEVVLLTGGDRRTMRVTEKRIRRYGHAGDQGALLPGDVVEVKKGFDWKPAEVVSVKGKRAMVRMEGALSDTSTWVSYLRAPGSGDEEAATVAKASPRSSNSSKPKAEEKPHPAEALEEVEEPELVAVSFAMARPIDFARGAATPTVTLDLTPQEFDFEGIRRLPAPLIPLENVFTSAKSAAASENGDLAAVLRVGFRSKSIVELVPLRDDAPTRLGAVVKGVTKLMLSPDATKLLTLRADSGGYYPKIDLWEILPAGEEIASGALKHVSSWSPDSSSAGSKGSSWFMLESLQWLDEGRLLTIGKEGAHDKHRVLVLWDLEKVQPLKTLKLEGDYALFGESGYLLINEAAAGLRVVELNSMEQVALIGKGQMMAGKPTVSPSGRWLLVSQAGKVEFWDLAQGKKILQTMLAVPGAKANQVAKWTQEEPYIRVGDENIDVRDYSLAGPLQKRSLQSVAWSVDKSGKSGLALTAERNLAPLAEPEVQLNAEGPFRYKQGDAVSLELVVDRSIESEARETIVKMLAEQQTRVVDDSEFVIRATLTTHPPKTQEFGKFGARQGDKDNISVTYTPRSYLVELLIDGEVVRSNSSYQGPGLFRAKDKNDIRRQVQAATQSPSGKNFPKLELPERLIVAATKD